MAAPFEVAVAIVEGIVKDCDGFVPEGLLREKRAQWEANIAAAIVDHRDNQGEGCESLPGNSD